MGYRVVALSSSPAKAELARSLGAEVYLDSSKVNQAEALQQLGGANLIMCTAPNAEIIRGLLPGLAVNGELLILAVTGDASIPLCACGFPAESNSEVVVLTCPCVQRC